MIPGALKDRPQWVVWKRITRKGKPTKVPLQPNGSPAKSNDPSTWSSFREALEALRSKQFDGVGFMLAEGDGLAGIDLDHCYDQETGEIAPKAAEILSHFPNAYIEFSPSGDGLHIWTMGKPKRCGKGTDEKWIEIYDYTSPRYLTVTNRPFGTPGQILDQQTGLDWLHEAYFQKPSDSPSPSPSPSPSDLSDAELIAKACKKPKFAALWAGQWEGAYPSHSEADAALCAFLAFWCGGDGGWIDRLFRQSGLMRDKWDSKRGSSTYGSTTINKACENQKTHYEGPKNRKEKSSRPEKESETPRSREDGRPLIKLKGGALNRVLSQMERAILALEHPPLFQRGGRLMRIVFLDRETEGKINRQTGAPQLIEVTPGWLCCQLQLAARFQKWDVRRNDWAEVDLPERYAKIFIEGREWNLPVLQSIVEAPLMRLDGTVHVKPGYDPSSRCFFHLADQFEAPERVSAEDVKWAIELFVDLFSDFPWEAPHDFSAMLAAILTDLIRPLLPLAPMFAIRAPVMGSGKTLLGRIVSLITTGRDPAVLAHPGDEIEFAKSIFAALLGGDRMIFIDNIEEILQSPTLCAVVTSEEFAGRILGQSQMLKVSTRVTWILTGNNLEVHGDLIRRVLPIDLDPQMERPAERQFARDIVQHIKENRRDYLNAALILMMNYAQAGAPSQGVTLGTFEQWSKWVRSPLIFAGLADPCAGLADWEESDRVSNNLRMLLNAWAATDWGHLPMKAQEIIQRSSEWPDLLEALIEICGDHKGILSARALGRWLIRWVNRIEGGLRLEKAHYDGHTKVNHFKVVRMN